jgi:hypothetical protein
MNNPAYIDKCAKTSLLICQLDRARVKLKGTPRSSAFPDSLGDRMFNCALALASPRRFSDYDYWSEQMERARGLLREAGVDPY